MMLRNVNLRSAAAVILIAGVMLVLAKEIYKVPKPLLLFASATFVLSASVFWRLSRARRRPVFVPITAWLLSWVLATAALLVGLYRFDKAGWMWFKVTGYNETLPENYADRVTMTCAEFVAHYPFFSCDALDSTKLILPAGEHEIDETVIVPAGLSLTIAPGTELRFGVGCSLISYGALIAAGTAEAPILFTAQNRWRKWGVVGVVRGGKSVFTHARFEHGRQALINSVHLPGTLSIIATEAEVAQCEFVNLFGKDCAYVNAGQAIFRNNTFCDSFKDGVDFDGGAGEISHNQFDNCGDEAIDLDEDSRVRVFANSIRGSKDANSNAVSEH